MKFNMVGIHMARQYKSQDADSMAATATTELGVLSGCRHIQSAALICIPCTEKRRKRSGSSGPLFADTNVHNTTEQLAMAFFLTQVTSYEDGQAACIAS